MGQVVLVLPHHWHRHQYDCGQVNLAKGNVLFLCCQYSLGTVLQHGEVSDIVIQQSHLQDMLLHSNPLGLVHRLVNVEPLPFGCISSEDHELMQLKTVSEGCPCLQMPTFGHLTVHSSPQVTMVHLLANVIPWDCASLERRFLRSLYVLAMALL